MTETIEIQDCVVLGRRIVQAVITTITPDRYRVRTETLLDEPAETEDDQ